MSRRRVVITGLGAVTALGSSVDLLWDGLINGRSGIRRITQFDPSDLPCQIGGEIPDFDPEKYIERKEARRLPRSTQIALASAMQAVQDAGLPDTMPEPERASVVFGTAMGGTDNLIEGLQIFWEKGYQRVNPFVLPSGIPNLSGFAIAKQYQCLGPNSTIVTACATGTQTVGEGAELIRRGAADVVITGGTEALMRDYAIAGFAVMRALPVNYNDAPDKASRPFDLKREGFVFSEGAAAIVLESLEHAQARGAEIYAEVIGQSSSADGYHIAAPHPEGLGAIRTMKWALQDAGISPEDVDYINTHGSSTPLNDVIETNAIKNVFGEHAYQLVISSTKSMLGHAMGASGTIEAIACILAMRDGIVPPTINYEYPDPECDLDCIPNQAREKCVDIALSNSFGLGGQNACLVIKRFQE
ncbi:MAG TPA: beta-ketoacyl-[acyl-carrier-protein] synthase II [Chloroflexi bacterium]|nr:beta-ketoacyl-[acyl-carrier-protein] synthase II [Chloroflexota bacterium]HBY08648.1 beta-ketoacyl-[acyl-carrier-protein] synthase II [Chloroflexota bacterium]